MKINSARIVGSGLIGTSIGLALSAKGISVEVADINPEHQALASDLLSSAHELTNPDLVVIATPPSATLSALLAEYDRTPNSIFIDISGLKSELMPQVEKFMEISQRFCSTHPMAGREKSGPQSARADLFEGRAWILVPTAATSSEAMEVAAQLVAELGATAYEMSALEHDAAIAAISHMPQLLSSLMGSTLVTTPESALGLAGQGLRDVSRLAASDSALWSELFLLNRNEILPKIAELTSTLDLLAIALREKDQESIANFFQEGNLGAARIPGKHGAKKRDYTYLPIVIEDKPGELVKIFAACSEIGVNVEDLSIEHSPGQESGLVTLSLSDEDAQRLHQHLVGAGWSAHSPRR